MHVTVTVGSVSLTLHDAPEDVEEVRIGCVAEFIFAHTCSARKDAPSRARSVPRVGRPLLISLPLVPCLP